MVCWFLALLIPYMHIDMKFQALHRACTVGTTIQAEVREVLSWFNETTIPQPANGWRRELPPGGWVCEYKHVVTRESFHVYYDSSGCVSGFAPTYE